MTKFLIAAVVLMTGFSARAQHTSLAPGAVAPAFSLPGVDGKKVSFANYPAAKGFIVVFTCNTCPYSRAYERRLVALDSKYKPLGYPVIAINPNDPAASPGEHYDKMKTHAREAGFTFPYLYDEGQTVTSLYAPKSTPHVFVVSRSEAGNVVEYSGAVDSDTQDADPDKTRFLEDAINALLSNKKPALTTTKAIGCSIKWKKS